MESKKEKENVWEMLIEMSVLLVFSLSDVLLPKPSNGGTGRGLLIRN